MEYDKKDRLRVGYSFGDACPKDGCVWPCPNDRSSGIDGPNDGIRGSEIKRLTSLLLDSYGPYVLALDSRWGSGKTFFVHLWRCYLENGKHNGKDKIHSIYLNAWESDYIEDPMLSLLVQIQEWIKEDADFHALYQAEIIWKSLRKEVTKMIKSDVATTALDTSLFQGAPVLTTVKRCFLKIKSQLFKGAKHKEKYKKTQEPITNFRNMLQGIIEGIVEERQKNLIIFVDELDRCNPAYAISMLERIKHLFDIPRITFVLSMNLEQLSESVKGFYGAGFDGSGYMKRFVDNIYKIQDMDMELYSYCIFDSFGINDLLKKRGFSKNDNAHLSKAAKLIFPHAFSNRPRDINQLASRLKIALRLLPDDFESNHASLIVLFCFLVLKAENPDLYDMYKKGKNMSDYSTQCKVIEFLTGVDAASGTDQETREDELPENIGYIAGLIMGLGRDQNPGYARSIAPKMKKWYDGQNYQNSDITLSEEDKFYAILSAGGVPELENMASIGKFLVGIDRKKLKNTALDLVDMATRFDDFEVKP